jgi:hypothetical protein
MGSPEEQPPKKPRHTIQDPKMMVTVACNSLGFDLLDSRPKGRTFNAEYYRDNVLSALLPLCPRLMGENSRRQCKPPHVSQMHNFLSLKCLTSPRTPAVFAQSRII